MFLDPFINIIRQSEQSDDIDLLEPTVALCGEDTVGAVYVCAGLAFKI